MGIRMLHRRKAHARVHATATADTRLAPGAAPWTRPRPALAPGAATPRVPWNAATVLRTAAARLGRLGARPAAGWALRLVPRFVPRGDTWCLWAEAVRGYLSLAHSALGRLRRPRTSRRIPAVPVVPVVPVFVVTATPLTERPDGPASR